MSVDGPVRALVPEVQSENATSLLRDHFMFALEERFKFFSSASHFNMISKLVRVTLGANTENIRQTIQNEFRSAGMQERNQIDKGLYAAHFNNEFHLLACSSACDVSERPGCLFS
eukprot:m.153519 g.153519  ORF g.153519 m.153519 type:complete len:115 (-) comp24593_c0_seq2:331-675(-)